MLVIGVVSDELLTQCRQLIDAEPSALFVHTSATELDQNDYGEVLEEDIINKLVIEAEGNVPSNQELEAFIRRRYRDQLRTILDGDTDDVIAVIYNERSNPLFSSGVMGEFTDAWFKPDTQILAVHDTSQSPWIEIVS